MFGLKICLSKCPSEWVVSHTANRFHDFVPMYLDVFQETLLAERAIFLPSHPHYNTVNPYHKSTVATKITKPRRHHRNENIMSDSVSSIAAPYLHMTSS